MTNSLRRLPAIGVALVFLGLVVVFVAGQAARGSEAVSAEAQAVGAVAGPDGCVKSFRTMIDMENINATADRPGMTDTGVFVGDAEEVPDAWGATLVGADASGLWIVRGEGDAASALHIVGFELPSGRSVWVIAGGISRGDCKVWQENPA